MARTTPYNQPLSPVFDETEHDTIAASQSVPYGTFAVNDGGEIKKYTQALMAGGAKFLGFAMDQACENTSGVSVTKTYPYKFRRNTRAEVDGYTGDEPDLANVGGTVYLRDNFSVGKTNPGSCVAVVLLAMNTARNGSRYVVRLP